MWWVRLSLESEVSQVRRGHLFLHPGLSNSPNVLQCVTEHLYVLLATDQEVGHESGPTSVGDTPRRTRVGADDKDGRVDRGVHVGPRRGRHGSTGRRVQGRTRHGQSPLVGLGGRSRGPSFLDRHKKRLETHPAERPRLPTVSDVPRTTTGWGIKYPTRRGET